MSARGEFSSRLGFVLAAAGSAVGLGNIWGFPTKVASNGGAAFVLMYLILAFLLAYPVLMAELVIGRATRANTADAFERITGHRSARLVGYWGFITVSLILSFYALVAGWMLAHFVEAGAQMVGFTVFADWLTSMSLERNILFSALFIGLTAGIVIGGVKNGIERWSVRLMPTLLLMIVSLIVYVSMQDGAAEGWKRYLLPDFSAVLNADLLIDAMGQAFFSMSLGVGTMLVYGSYVRKQENLPTLGAWVALVDIGVAILAGMLIIPAMYVALQQGVQIFDANGSLIGGDTLIFTVLPALFESMGVMGFVVALVFFALMTIAALTSSISMLEVPVSYVVENRKIERKRAVWMLAALIFFSSAVIALNFELLFGAVISFTTEYSQPLLGLVLCIFAGWLWKRDNILQELKAGNPDIEKGLFWKIWPWYIKFVCPAIIAFMFIRSLV